MKRIKEKKWIWIIAVVAVIGIAIAIFTVRGRATSAAASEGIGETALVQIGDLAESATASGQVEAQREAALSLAFPGLVKTVLVREGDTVQQGDVLIQLENAALQRAVRSAEQEVAIAEANLAKLIDDPSAAELAAAEAAVTSAQIKLDSLLNGPTAEEIAASEASVNAAQAGMWSASGNVQAVQTVSSADILEAEANLQDARENQQAAHDTWVNLAICKVNDDGTHTCTPKVENERMEAATEEVRKANAQVAIAQAKLDELEKPDSNNVASSQAGWSLAAAQYDAAVARHEALIHGATNAEIAAAEAELASARAALDSLLSGPSASDLKVHETRVAQAQTSLREALNALADATLAAPFEGVVTAVHVSPGELASGIAVEIVDNNSLEVILNVDEIDVGQLAVGQPAIVSMETWPDAEFNSEITAIAPAASTTDSGVVSYEVHLSLTESNLPILVGMTADADLITQVGEEVLLVPNAAVMADRDEGTYSVNVVRTQPDGSKTVREVEISIGLRDKEFAQVLGGLVEGDEVLLGEIAAPTIDFGGGPRGRAQ
ncbi:MAG: efflux RND transporter periplasmic adaptor subunit [Candidatus Promineifilaceae bacterium]|nr:efflux RND transporter periplasmic adaptor subunit [Candidatus Promineifilaceae bacterium]